MKILMIDRVVLSLFLFSSFLSHLKQRHQKIYNCQHLWPKSWRAGHLATVGVRNDQDPSREQVWTWKVNKFELEKYTKYLFFLSRIYCLGVWRSNSKWFYQELLMWNVSFKNQHLRSVRYLEFLNFCEGLKSDF